MVDPIVLEIIWNILFVMEVVVGWMEDGVTGHLGQSVEVIVRNLDTEVVTIHLPKMEGVHVNLEILVFKQTHVQVKTFHEEISMLFCSEKFYGWWWVGDIAIIATSSRSRSLRDLR